ncbi:glycosyltransferase family 8 protein [Aspergillus luchuensis CBS 106.47]|uniref:Glycosyltransferase family 8 protein n=1 Tax=Aspergillus luchuensis (strain CBS 106.47) TaxID=1137211 RepID=A0A1M3TXE5_ASPLC|nr:glycosyltransferase family 8 protein [Aspergillus luchuensis CBS 106.47]
MTSKYPKFVRALLIAVLMLAMLAISLRHLSASISLQESQLDHLPEKQINWSRFAYTQYATDRSYLCNSVMIFEALHRLGSKADLVLMYPSHFLVSEEDDSPEARLLRFARDKYAVKLKPMEVIYKGGGGETWSRSYTKLLTFNQTEYDRVIHLDSDATLLQTMDELFLLPSAPVAMPLAYWFHQEDKVFTSALMLIEPSTAEFSRLTNEIWEGVSGGYDMDIVNRLYGDTALIIPHRPYMLLTGEFRSKDHEAYLGNADETWDADRVLEAAKYLHFSDWPVPKPWITATQHVLEETQPPCEVQLATGQQDDCHARQLWLGMYEEFRSRRQNICGVALS